MLELGTDSRKEHQQLVESLRNKGFINVLLIGPEFSATEHEGFKTFDSTESARSFLEKQKVTGALVLLKGSRGMKLEGLAAVL
jgi:UDP-N-acetylmuramoyl-tripeptide--D-alanyl-D-alanine ligase